MHADGSTSRWLDDLALDDDEDRAPPRRRPRLLLVGATVPWLVVGAVLALPHLSDAGPDTDLADTGDQAPITSVPDDLGPGVTGTDPPTDPHPDDPTDAPAPAASDDPDVARQPDPAVTDGDAAPRDAAGAEALDLLELRGDWRVEAGVEEAAALAVVVARAWLTGMDPVLHIDGLDAAPNGRYAEHLVVEAVERPTTDLTVVTVLAVVLDNGDTLRAEVQRVAVPVTWLDGRPRPGGPPWALPAPDLTPHRPATDEITDVDLHDAAEEALLVAGYTDVQVRSLHVTGSGAVVADVAADTPGGVVDGPLWLRHHVDGYVVAGTTLTGGPSS